MDMLASDSLRAFGVFADRCSFTAAAQQLHISQPALHVKIQKLSRELGETLYQRRGRHLILTPAGEALAAFAREQRTQLAGFLNEFKGFENRPLVLACGRGAFLNVIDAGIAASLKKGIELTFIIENTPELVALVDQRTADLAVGVFGRTPPRSLLKPLASYQQTLVVPRAHPFARRASLKVCDLDSMSLAVPPRRWPQRRSFDTNLADAGVTWQVAVEAPGWELLMHLARLGVAPAITNSCVPVISGLVAIPIEDLPVVTYSALLRRDAGKRPTNLLQVLQEHVR